MVISALLVFMRFCMSIFTYLKRGKGTTVFSEAYFERCWIINWKKTSPSSYSIYPFFWCYWILWFLPKKNMLPLFRRDKITITASLTHTHLCVRQILVGIVFFAAASVLPPQAPVVRGFHTQHEGSATVWFWWQCPSLLAPSKQWIFLNFVRCWYFFQNQNHWRMRTLHFFMGCQHFFFFLWCNTYFFRCCRTQFPMIGVHLKVMVRSDNF